MGHSEAFRLLEPDELEPNPLVERLVPDPGSDVRDFVALDGFLGRSTIEDNWRLYFDRTLSFWFEIPKRAIQLGATVGAGPDALTFLWVDRTAELRATAASGEEPLAELLQGPFTVDQLLPPDLDVPELSETGLVCGPGGHTRKHYKTRCY